MSGRCRSTKRHFDTAWRADARLAEILDAPLDPSRLYTPAGVVRCTCGRYVLTSNAGRQFASGKRSRRPQARQRRRG